MSKYSVTSHPVETLLTWIKSKEIAIPEIQRPFVWKAKKVRDLIDSLYHGYPTGYIITWRNPNVKLKNGKTAGGDKILIDGQQRITALQAAIVGQRVLNKNYKEISINIAFNPITTEFKVMNKAIERSPLWINSVNHIFQDDFSQSKFMREYLEANPDLIDKEGIIEQNVEKLKQIKSKQIGVIELDASLDIDTVTEIFIRINQKGVVLSNADFVMSKIAADEVHDGNKLRKLIDYFCRLIVDKDFNKHIIDNDKDFAALPYYQGIKWMAKGKDDLYIPDYIDMLRASFTYKFSRGKFSDLVALLSGRNFESRTYEAPIIECSFKQLAEGLMDFTNQTNYQRFIMLVKSAGFIKSSLISSQNSLNFSYGLYLKLRKEGLAENEIQHLVKRWLVMALLTGRYSGSSESAIDEDIKQINEKGIAAYLKQMEQTHLGDNFWDIGLPDNLVTSSTSNNAYNVYLAAQCTLNSPAFLAKDMKISSLIEQRGDIHHIFPKKYLSANGFVQKQYNQVANYVYTEQATNIKIGADAPAIYFKKVQDEMQQGILNLTSLESKAALLQNIGANDMPQAILTADHKDYETFLTARRQLMAQKIKTYYEQL